MLLDGAVRMRAHLHDKEIADAQLGTDPSSIAVTPLESGVGEFSQVAGAHQNFGLRQPFAQLRIARQRSHEAEVNRIDHRIEDRLDAAALGHCGGAQQRGDVAVRGGDEHGDRAGVGREIERELGEAEQEVRSGLRTAVQLIGVADPR